MKKYQSVRLFKNPLLEWVTHVHPITPLVVWTPIIGGLIWKSFAERRLEPWSIGVLLMAGGLFWTFFEYLAHRFLFHYEGKSKVSKYIVYLFHGIHHEDPLDPTRLVMPPVAGLILASGIWIVLRPLVGELCIKSFFAGFLTGYLCYDYTHFAVHHFTPRTPIGKYLKQYHMVHHYVAPTTRFGVSSPLWDFVFSTAERQQPKSSQTLS